MVSAVTSSGTPAAGAKVTVRAVVRNTGRQLARASRLSVGLEGMGAPLARAKVAKLKAGKRTSVSLSVTFPRVIALGRHRIVVCADFAKQVKESSEKNNCRALPQVLEGIATPPVPPTAEMKAIAPTIFTK